MPSSRGRCSAISRRTPQRGRGSRRCGICGKNGAAWILGDSATDTFPARIDREPACALGVVDFDPARGLVQHVGIRGIGSVEPFDRALAERLLANYLGSDATEWDRRFADYLDEPTGTALLIRVDPETVVARDQSYAPTPAH